ncbi:MAG: hypothetical protein MUE36_06250 [Acidimicrobiales bacterium]|nr:hypothetical protein [Acidimicrobiales bacterium]
MRFAVESWAPDYGSPTGAMGLVEGSTAVDPWAEAAVGEWAPRRPRATAPFDAVAFVDGVRRIDANVIVTSDAGDVHRGICASFAAGVVRCAATAEVVVAEVRRALFVPVEGAEALTTRHGRFDPFPTTSDEPDVVSLRLQRAMGDLEAEVARWADDVDVVVADGPLRGGLHAPGFVGYVKTHHATYGPALVREVVAALAPGERTPLLLLGAPWPRWSWYLRLPGEVHHGWAGIVRLEAVADTSVAEAVALADRVSATLPRFASVPQKDPRAPQNLVPIGGLERLLRHRLGDPDVLLRALRVAAAASA